MSTPTSILLEGGPADGKTLDYKSYMEGLWIPFYNPMRKKDDPKKISEFDRLLYKEKFPREIKNSSIVFEYTLVSRFWFDPETEEYEIEEIKK